MSHLNASSDDFASHAVGTDVGALLTILRHKTFVADKLFEMASQLENRARIHDLSKLKDDEFDGFVHINIAAKRHAYGSEEMKEAISSQNCVGLHKSRNSHHPEYYDNVSDMPFLDVVEMVCDWHGASSAYGQTKLSDSVPDLLERYDFNEGQRWLIGQVVEWLDS